MYKECPEAGRRPEHVWLLLELAFKHGPQEVKELRWNLTSLTWG